MKLTARLFGSILFCSVALAAGQANARPGTPNGVTATSPMPASLVLSWRNTASEDGVVFDLEGRSDPSVANYNPYGQYNGNRIGTVSSYTFLNLAAGTHCFRVWSRVGAQGLRSDQPSAWACANVAAGVPAHHPPHH